MEQKSFLHSKAFWVFFISSQTTEKHSYTVQNVILSLQMGNSWVPHSALCISKQEKRNFLLPSWLETQQQWKSASAVALAFSSAWLRAAESLWVLDKCKVIISSWKSSRHCSMRIEHSEVLRRASAPSFLNLEPSDHVCYHYNAQFDTSNCLFFTHSQVHSDRVWVPR